MKAAVRFPTAQDGKSAPGKIPSGHDGTGARRQNRPGDGREHEIRTMTDILAAPSPE
ncbi:hypothetical protein KCP74_25200 [Salmonella enterica subsp. enterica]|nr:hypothetical protein KCP74_25200 [Salmonella enterica subsp. enterica]